MSIQQDVLMIGWEYPPHNSGGLGVACEGLTVALSQQKIGIDFTLPYLHSQAVPHMKVIVCQGAGGPYIADATQPPFAAYQHLQPVKTKSLRFNPQDVRKMPASEIEYRVNEYADSIIDTVQHGEKSYDLIHAHDWMTYPAARLLKKKFKRPFIAHIHSTEFDRVPNGFGNGYIAHTEYEGLQDADRIIAVSEFTKQVLIEKYAVPAEKIDVIHNGIAEAPQVETMKFAENRPVIVFMGRLTMQKGAEYFLQLARSVLSKIPEALFIVAGHGDQYNFLLLENARNQLSSSLLFTGFLRGKQKDYLLQRADVFVMPSIAEPFGLVALEAVQRETPVIISKNSGVKEVLPGAITIDFWDVDKMTENIIKLLEDKDFYHQIVNAQLEDIAKVTWDSAADKVKQVYQRILTARS